MEIKKYILVGSVIACLIVASCANSQEKYDNLKLTAYKLLNFLKDRDSLKITQLFENRDMLLRKEKYIVSDCNLVLKMIDKHGFPKFDELKWRKDEDGSNIIWISLFDKPDSLMNLKKCDLMVYFYPDSLITSTDKFLSYNIYTELLIAPSKKIIEAPLIKIE